MRLSGTGHDTTPLRLLDDPEIQYLFFLNLLITITSPLLYIPITMLLALSFDFT